VAEAWYQKWFCGENAVDQVTISKEELKRLGIEIKASDGVGSRRLDIVDDGHIKELKNVTEELGTAESNQYDNYRKLVGQQIGVPPKGGGPAVATTIKSLTYVFPDPKGGIANADWIATRLKQGHDVIFEVFAPDGRLGTFDKAAAAGLDAGALARAIRKHCGDPTAQ
jgi:hypothetical protein